MIELARTELAKRLAFRSATPNGWAWTWQRCGRYEYRKCLTHLTNPDHLIANVQQSPANLLPLRTAPRYAAGRKRG